jgi:hypothetical protein
VDSSVASSPVHTLAEDEQQSLTFTIDWVCTTPLSFYKIKHLKNALNENRPLKIARDGTEIDAETAQELLKIWKLDELIQSIAGLTVNSV